MNIQLRTVWIMLALLSALVFSGCGETSQQDQVSDAANHFSDSTIQAIYRLQDERKSNELASFFTSESSVYRRHAAMAMASVQDPGMIPYLSVLLDDQSPGVRKAAAYALGQLYDSAALIPLAGALHGEDSSVVVREIVESIGKVLTQDSVSIIHEFSPENDLEKEGLAWGLYRAGIRNVHDPLFVQRAVALLDTSNTYQTRLGAAHFLARSPNLELAKYSSQLRKSAAEDPAPNVRMAIAGAFGKLTSKASFTFVSTNLLNDQDYRVRINALRSLGAHPSRTLMDTTYFFESLSDDNVNVRIASAEILTGMEGMDPEFMMQQALRQTDARVRTLLFANAVRNGWNYPNAVEVIKEEYSNSQDPYYRAGLLSALGYSPVAYDFIVTQVFSDVEPVVSTAGVSALVEMRGLDGFPASLEQPFADVMREVMKTGDIGMIYYGAQLLSNKEYDFREIYENIDFLYEAKNMLDLPKDNEALQVLNATIAYFEGAEEVPETVNPYNNPVDWEMVKRIPAGLEVDIHTTRGVITMKMKTEAAPGSVANFLNLAGNGYYDGIFLHRVVPNFVVQGGCPRGDGFGGEDYSIRSEFPDLRYKEGTVGMASAGKDTEGTQWFITHSPTPHLDGRYTIFAQVIAGMEVVHQLEVGDRIEKISIPEY